MADDDKSPKDTAVTNEEAKAEETPKAVAAKEETKTEVSAKEEKKETPKNDKKLSTKLEKIAKAIEGLTALELSELSGHLEEVFGVSAMPMAVGAVAAPAQGGEAAAPAEEKSTYDVVLTDGGANKLNVIKAVREFRQDLGLMDAKKLVESAPQTVLEGAKKDDAESAKKKIEEAGGKVELK